MMPIKLSVHSSILSNLFVVDNTPNDDDDDDDSDENES